MYGRAGPLLMSTRMFLLPISTLFQFKPDRESRLSRSNSGSRGWSRATSFQSIPRSPIAFTTCWRSSKAASFFDEHVERLEDADAVEVEDTMPGTIELDMGNDVVVVRGVEFDVKGAVGASTISGFDERVEIFEF